MYPESLFKYIPFKAPKLDNSDTTQQKRQSSFEKGQIWFPQAHKLNDPFECNPYFQNFEYSERDIEEAVDSLSDKDLKGIEFQVGISTKADLIHILKTPDFLNQDRFDKIADPPNKSTLQSVYRFIHQIVFVEYIKALFSTNISNIGILSMSEDPFNLRMWAHYGGNSEGICMEFERNPKNLLGSDRTKPIDYVKERPRIKLHERSNKLEEIIFTKSHLWSYEKEWRLWQPEGGKSYAFPGEVRRILFGLNCDKDTIELTKSIFGKDIIYEDIIFGESYAIISDNGIHPSIYFTS